MTTNIINIVNLTAITDDAESLRQALIELAQKTENEPGCISFKFYQYQQNTKQIILIENFQDHTAMQQHLQTKHTLDFFNKNIVNVETIEAINAY